MNTIGTARFVSLTLIMAGALAVSGCGGGGGGGSFKSAGISTPPAEDPTPPAEDPTPPAEDPTPPAEDPTPPAEDPTAVLPRDQSSTLLHTFDSVVTEAAQRRHIRAAAAEAAGNTPRSGSVTQSSTGDGVTTGSVSVSVERDASGTASYGKISYTVRETAGWSVDRARARVLASRRSGEWEGIEFHQAPEGGEGSGTGPGLYVYAYTDIKVPSASIRVTNAAVNAGLVYITSFNGVHGELECESMYVDCRYDALFPSGRITSVWLGTLSFTPSNRFRKQHADYLAGGIWIRVPEDAASVADYEFGAFADGHDPFEQANLEGLTGTATYTGDARAVHSHQETNRNYFVEGDVSLTADFGDDSSLGSISGTVSNFTGEGPEPDWYDGISVQLGTAEIGNADSGFFTGDTTTTGTDSAFTGKWGGQFYSNGDAAGDHPAAAAGTFGAATADGSQSFIGAYGARREQE